MKPKFLAGAVLILGIVAWLYLGRRTPGSVAEQRTPGPSSVPQIKAPLNPPAEPRQPTAALHLTWSASPQVLPVVDSQFDFSKRLASIKRLTSNQVQADSGALQAFLSEKDSMDESQLGQVIKNELLDKLCALSPPPGWLADVLVKMFHDHSQDEVIRDYAVQHMVTLYEVIRTSGPQNSEAARDLQNTLWEALGETGNSIAGTAILGLNRMSKSDGDIDREKLASTAIRLADNGGAGQLARISAFQVCGDLKATEVEQLLTYTAQGSEPIPLRISAIGALGTLGDPGAIAPLTVILNGDEPRLKLPAQQALRRIAEQERKTKS